MIYNVVEFDQFMTRFQQSSDQQISVTDKHHSTIWNKACLQFHQVIFSSIFTVPGWQGRPWWGRALPSSGCPRSVSSWTASRTCGKIGACAASCARQTGKERDRWFYWPGWCIWPIMIINYCDWPDTVLQRSYHNPLLRICSSCCAFAPGAAWPWSDMIN